MGKYMVRPVLALERLLFLEREGKIGYRYGENGAELDTMDYLELIARVISHIPDKGQVSLEGEPAARFPLPTVAPLPASLSRASPCDQGVIPRWIPRQLWQAKAVMVRTYDLYANAHRGKVKKASHVPVTLGMIEEESRPVPSRGWAEMIRIAPHKYCHD